MHRKNAHILIQIATCYRTRLAHSPDSYFVAVSPKHTLIRDR